MRKFKKKLLAEKVSELEELEACLKLAYEKKREEQLLFLLQDMQELAVEFGTETEKQEGEACYLVRLAEEYCELLWECAAAANPERKKWLKLIAKKRMQIQNELKFNVSETYEAVFFPYKASMWDSLESVWLAAVEDETCDCYVVPIPYYSKKTNGAFDKKYYEGDQFPDYVPITDYQSYDLRARKPEIAFIHNLYDENNLVTSIHPAFYAREIRKYAGTLAYVPYFVFVGEIAEQFYSTPAMIHVDKIFVQSQEVRQSYIDVMRAKAGLTEKQFQLLGIDNKVVALGSPKCDRVLNIQKEKFPLPAEWRNKMETGKKVIFYNTSIAPLLERPEFYLKKLGQVLQIFKEQSDFLLWWRPHPLLSETIKTMYPNLLPEYKKLIDQYAAENWGIYDDGFDLDAAIAYTDCYYGDLSSVVLLYAITGKPVMTQSILDNLKKEDEVFTTWFEGIAIVEGEGWFSASNTNALLKMDMESHQIEFIGRFPGEELNAHRLYSQVKEYKNKLLFAPMAAKEIAIYDRKSGEFKKIAIKEEPPLLGNPDYNTVKFFSIHLYKKWAFIVGCSYPAILRLDMETGEITYYQDWLKELEPHTCSRDVYFISESCEIENKFYQACCNANVVLEFDMASCHHRIYEIHGYKGGFAGIAYDGTDFWLCPRTKGAAVRWNRITGETSWYGNYPQDYEPGDFSGRFIRVIGEKVWLIPGTANEILTIDMKSGEMTCEAKLYPLRDSILFHYHDVFWENGELRLLKADNSKVIHCEDGIEAEDYPVSMPEQFWDKFWLQQLGFSGERAKYAQSWRECLFADNEAGNWQISLKGFLNYVSECDVKINQAQIDKCKEVFSNLDGTAGKQIYSAMKSAVNAR